jgi:PAS domain S-box-containing protein
VRARSKAAAAGPLRKAEEALKDAEQRFAAFVEDSAYAYVEMDLEGAFTFANRRAEEISGYPAAELRGMSYRDLVLAEELERSASELEDTIAGSNPGPREHRIRRKDGSVADLEVNALPLRKAGRRVGFQLTAADITERKRAEEALKKSEVWFRSLIELGASVYAVVDAEGNVLYESPSLERVYGWRPEELVGRSVFEHVHPDDLEYAKASFAELIANPGASKRVELRFRHKDASWLTIEVAGVNLIDNPAVGGVVLTSHDVSERKWAEEALRQAKGRFAAFVEDSAFGYVEMDLEGNVTFVNRRAGEMSGYTPEELRGMNFRDLVAPDELERAAEELRNVYSEQNTGPRDHKIILKDGGFMHIEVNALPLKTGGKPFGYQLTIADISERVKAEAALRESETRFRELADLLPEIVYEMDERGVLTYVNRHAYKMTGYTEEDLERGFEAVNVFVPPDRERARKNIERLFKGELEGAREYTVLRKDGSTFPAMARSVRVVRDGRPVGLRGIIFDISDRKEMEHRLRQAAAMEAVGELAGSVANDFNNLLTGILGYANILKLGAQPGSDVFAGADVIEKVAIRAAELTRQLLGLAQKGKTQEVPFNVHDLIAEVAEEIEREPEGGIEVSRALEAPAPFVLGDPEQLRQVVANLAASAREAMPEGGRLTFATEVVEMDENDCRTHPDASPGRYFVLSVADTGGGIPEAIRDRIFEPFFTTKEEGDGTGMGLAMVYGIVKNHGGFSRVETETGRGTIFRIYVPLRGEGERRHEELRPGRLVEGKGTVLVVDDEDSVRDVLGRMLSSLGYEVETARDGREAVELYSERGGEIDLVLLDLAMPVMDGRECFAKLRELDPRVRVLLTTGQTGRNQAREFIDMGMAGFIQKPYVISRLSEEVARVLAATGG